MTKKTKEKVWVLRAQVIGALRRLFSKSPMKQYIINLAKVEVKERRKDGSVSKARRVKFKCASCLSLWPRNEVQLDHVFPVINPDTGMKDWDEYISRMFVLETWNSRPTEEQKELARTHFQALCVDCHKEKTAHEATIRNGSKVKRPQKPRKAKAKGKK